MNLTIKNLSCHYDKNVVFENFNININSGIYFINGQNGSGKTTLFNILYKLNKDYSGVIEINNININTLVNYEYRNSYIS
jgi:iron complex transport system ATP-binding protein